MKYKVGDTVRFKQWRDGGTGLSKDLINLKEGTILTILRIYEDHVTVDIDKYYDTILFNDEFTLIKENLTEVELLDAIKYNIENDL